MGWCACEQTKHNQICHLEDEWHSLLTHTHTACKIYKFHENYVDVDCGPTTKTNSIIGGNFSFSVRFDFEVEALNK